MGIKRVSLSLPLQKSASLGQRVAVRFKTAEETKRALERPTCDTKKLFPVVAFEFFAEIFHCGVGGG